MRIFIGLGSVMFVDKDGNERFTPQNRTDVKGLYMVDTTDIGYADLDLVGEEETPDGRTLNQYWDRIKELTKEGSK